MAEVIEFPSGPEFNRREIERLFAKKLEGAEPKYADCVRKGVARILDTYEIGNLPNIKLEGLIVPEGLDAATAVAFASHVCGKYKDAIAPFVYRIVIDLLRAEVELCKCRFPQQQSR